MDLGVPAFSRGSAPRPSGIPHTHDTARIGPAKEPEVSMHQSAATKTMGRAWFV